MDPSAATFRICTLASGSSGNCVYAECAEGALLIDAGISGRRIAAAIEAVGGSLAKLAAVVVSHHHIDHTRGAGVIARRHGVPLAMTQGTYDGARHALGKCTEPQLFRAGDPLRLGGFVVHSVATPHDARGSVALVVEREGLRAGVLSDLGHPFAALRAVMGTLDVAILESNYDPDMLSDGPYPERLKRRIRSPRGHLSNQEAAELLREHGSMRLQAVLLAHLSEENNRPELALATIRKGAGEQLRTSGSCLSAAPRHEPSEVISVGRR